MWIMGLLLLLPPNIFPTLSCSRNWQIPLMTSMNFPLVLACVMFSHFQGYRFDLVSLLTPLSSEHQAHLGKRGLHPSVLCCLTPVSSVGSVSGSISQVVLKPQYSFFHTNFPLGKIYKGDAVDLVYIFSTCLHS